MNGRKTSVSQGAGNAYGVSSPSSATRPGTRRRETVDSNPFSAGGLASPTAGRFNREESSPWFSRKGTENREAETENAEGEQASREAPSRHPYSTLTRSVTTGSSGGSMWPPSSAGQTTPGAGGFGNFAIGGGSVIGDKRVGSTAAGSRLAHLIPKDGAEASSPRASDMPNPLNQQSWRSRPRTDTDPFGDDGLSGSAVLGGAQDSGTSIPPQVGRIGTLSTPVKGSTSEFGMAGLNLGGDPDDNGPISPSETNPYRSPAGNQNDNDDHDRINVEKQSQHDQPPAYGTMPRGFPTGALDGSDRSQTSSVGAKGFPLPGMAGWPAAPGPTTGTPDRERAGFGGAFGSSLFNPMGDLQSPSLGALGNVFGPAGAGAIGTGSIGRGSKMGSLFPAAMQAQMHANDQEAAVNPDSAPDLRQSNPLGAIGRGNFPAPVRDTESPMRSNRGVFEELFPSAPQAGPFGVPDVGQSYTPGSVGGLPFAPGGQATGEPAPGQPRQMVMPDRMRWVYLDPQAKIQGPFTGLEMNDWYKANFFTPDLRVRKVEDPDFEPLGQLIRRIGNSREPFLVPQIGVAHGPAPQSGGPFAPTNSGVVPPLSGVFPSFGRTLTAEEQNNLERRKQEEQYLMAQQRDFIMRQQAMSKFQIPGQGLQHHSSAQSLQSQPSFGSMTSPGGLPPQHQQPIGAMPGAAGFFDTALGQTSGAANASGNMDPFSHDELAHLSMGERQMLANLQDTSGDAQQHGDLGVEGGLRSGLPGTEQLGEDSEGFRERLKQFEDLRAQHDAEQLAQGEQSHDSAELDAGESHQSEEPRLKQTAQNSKAARAAKKKALEEASLSLTQQVQQAQAAAAAAAYQVEEPDMPMPFPPPSSSTPLPAPMAQRARSNLPEQYSRSQSGTPDTNAPAQPPPLAPWAKEPTEAQRGPSLKEIQEAEARKAAKAEEAAAALRRAAMEQEVASLREREKAAATAAGLPASSTWAHESPASSASPWTKPGAVKGPAPGLSPATAANKKTLADIQREEELRKQKAAAREAPVAAVSATPTLATKSYANLAGKPGQAPIAGAGAIPVAAGWSTVGAGGKVKIPTGPSAQARAVSSPTAKPTAVVAPPKPMSKPVSINTKPNESVAMDEFNKWVHRELSRGIIGVNDSELRISTSYRRTTDNFTVANFQATLDVLPMDTGIISDAVYANSTTMDGRHFAEEFIRRKKLAEKGIIVEKQPSTGADGKAATSMGGGWSEVAKKGGPGGTPGAPVKEADQGLQGTGFKVVPSRKKGKR